VLMTSSGQRSDAERFAKLGFVGYLCKPVTRRDMAQCLLQAPGQTLSVKRGDPLLVIESPDVGVAFSDLDKAQADLTAAEHDYNRQKELVAAIQKARKVNDTVVVFLHWGTEAQQCPNSIQEPLAKALVKAGADIVLGTHAHVQLGAGYLGTAFVDYGLGNLAFYDTAPPETYSGALHITVTGRHIDSFGWRPALIEDGLPIPDSGSAATAARQRWRGLRGCTDLSATPTGTLATRQAETGPFSGPVIQPLGDPPGGSPGTTPLAAKITRDS